MHKNDCFKWTEHWRGGHGRKEMVWFQSGSWRCIVSHLLHLVDQEMKSHTRLGSHKNYASPLLQALPSKLSRLANHYVSFSEPSPMGQELRKAPKKESLCIMGLPYLMNDARRCGCCYSHVTSIPRLLTQGEYRHLCIQYNVRCVYGELSCEMSKSTENELGKISSNVVVCCLICDLCVDVARAF